MKSERSLRVGVMLDSFTMPAWIAKILGQLGDAEFVELALIVLNKEDPPARPRFSRLRAPRRDHLLFNLYRRLDQRWFRVEPDAFTLVDMSAHLATVPVLPVIPQRPKPFEHRFDADSIERIRAADLDVLLRFGFNIIRGEVLDSARCGVWSYHHGDSNEYRGSPDFFWEMYERNPVTGTLLQVLTEALDAGHVLYRSFAATDPTSLNRGRNAAYWKSAEFVLRCLAELHTLGWDHLHSARADAQQVRYQKGIYRTPNNRQMMTFLARLLAGIVSRQAVKRSFLERWYIAYRRVSASDAPLPGTSSPSAVRSQRFRRLSAPRGRWYADPFVVEHEGRYHLFFEDYDSTTGKGLISAAHVDDRGVISKPSRVLETSYHLSYPFVFRFDGDWYMLPETRDRRTIELFKAHRFPYGWTLERVLMTDVDAVDPTIVEHDGRLWLFANIAVLGGSVDDELHLFHADSLSGEWTPHARTPVVSDVRRARPAGRLIARNGTLIRPSQDSSQRYGGAVVFNRVTRLTETDYQESVIGRLEPAPRRGNVGGHTFNSAGGYEVVDAQRRSLKLLAWMRN